MGIFQSEKPRAYSHQYIYVNERKEKLAKIEENAKRDLGILPAKEETTEEKIRGKFVEGTKHLKRRKESGRKPLTTVTLLIALAIACYIMRYLITGELTF